MVKADLHNHLRTRSALKSKDLETAVETATKKLGYGNIIGMVNFSDYRYETLKLIADESKYSIERVGTLDQAFRVRGDTVDTYILKGQEIPTKEGHLLVMGLPYGTNIPEKRPLKETMAYAKDLGGIIIADHPFYLEGIGNHLQKTPELIQELDAIEIHNGEAALGLPFGPLPYKANEQASTFYQSVSSNNPQLGAISTSDGHSIYEVGSSWTELDLETTRKRNFLPELQEAIRNTNLETKTKKHNSYIGALDHITDLVTIIATNKLPGVTIR